MECPVCGSDCVASVREIMEMLPDIFSSCPSCRGKILDKGAPPPDTIIVRPCACGKRFIDQVFAHLYIIMVEEGDLKGDEPLSRVGTPLVHPGFVMASPPYLPVKSLVLLSDRVSEGCAGRLVREVPEIRGVVRSGAYTPGVVDQGLHAMPRAYQLLAGCDVRADIFYSQAHPIVIYKQQSLVHIEFPRFYNAKITSVTRRVNQMMPDLFIDACSGAGTLGIAGSLIGVRQTILNDAWYAAAFWSAYNLRVNSENLLVDEVRMLKRYEEMKPQPVGGEPMKVAETSGDQIIEVYQGDFRLLYSAIPKSKRLLTVIDLFEKSNPAISARIMKEWRDRVGGEVFIP